MDPSQASINANQPEQTETIICMDLKYYNAAAKGNIEVFKDVTDPQSLRLLLTPIKNTILHIYITTLKSKSKSTTTLDAGSESTTTPNAGSKSTTNFVKEILKMCPLLLWKTNTGLESTTTLKVRLESTTTLSVGSESTTNFVEEILKMCPSLLQQTNAKDETLLHIAARYGHDDIVKFLLDYCSKTLPQDLEDGIKPVEKMVRMTNKKRDTALHEAIRYNHPIVVELLIEKDSNFSYPANDDDETPLYIAVERRFESLVFKILAECKSPMHGGPLGRTALHAAIIAKDEGMAQIILDKIEGISRKVDNNGWTPLHLAAYFDYTNLTKLLLNKDREVAYIKDTKGMTALHIAAQCCSAGVMKSIVSMCPDCCELVDNEGWNVLHFLMKSDKWPWGKQRAINIIIENPSLRNLLNEKNANGDTPLHFYSNTLESVKNFVSHPQVDKMAFNEQNLSAYDIASTNTKLPAEKKLEIMSATNYVRPQRVITYEDEDEDKDKDKKKENERSLMLQKAGEAHLVVAALITTVTFAACITMPGGFAGGGDGSHTGSALLRRSAAFKAFVITDTISMVLSSSAVFIHLFMPFIKHENDDDEEHRYKILLLAFKFILGAMVSMGLAFVTGTYAVLVPSWDIAIPNFIIGLTFFASLLFGFLKLNELSFCEVLSDLIHYRYIFFKDKMERVL